MVSVPTQEHMCIYNETSYINGKQINLKVFFIAVENHLQKIMSQLFSILTIHTHTLIDAVSEVGPTFPKERQ